MHSINIKFLISLNIILMSILNGLVFAESQTLVIAKISELQTQQEYIELKSKVQGIAELMKEEGVVESDVLLAKTINEMIVAINKGKVNWVSDTLYMTLILAEKIRGQIFIRESNKAKMSRTVFFVNKKSNISSIKNIEKKIILFENSRSSSSYFIPFYELTNHGYTPREYGKIDKSTFSENKRIYYRFEPDRRTMLKVVESNTLNIGVMTELDYHGLDKKTQSKFKLIYQTVQYPLQLDMIVPEQDLTIKIKLKKLLKNKPNKQIASPEKTIVIERRFEKFIAQGKDGFVFLKNIIQHGVVPLQFEKEFEEN